MNIVQSLSKRKFRIIFSFIGSFIFFSFLSIIFAVLLNSIYPLQSNFETSVSWYLLLAVSYWTTFCVFYLISTLLSKKEKMVWSVIFIIFLLGVIIPKKIIQNNRNNFPIEDQKQISQAFQMMYQDDNPSGVKIRSFENTSGGYSIYVDEYGFFGFRDGYYFLETESSVGSFGSAKSGNALKILPYFLLAFTLGIFVSFKFTKVLIANLFPRYRKGK